MIINSKKHILQLFQKTNKLIKKGGMEDKKKKKIRKILHLYTWQIFLILIPMLFLDATLLRTDHLKMVELRDAVLAADEEEDDEKIAKSLEELKNFVFGHIIVNVVEENGSQNIIFGTGPFYLENTYIRIATKALADAEGQLSGDDNPNGNIFIKASDVCKPLGIANGWNWNSPGYLNCMTSEIAKYPAADPITDQVKANIPSTELFRRNYASPAIALCPSGIAIIVTLALILIIVIRMVIWVILRVALLFM